MPSLFFLYENCNLTKKFIQKQKWINTILGNWLGTPCRASYPVLLFQHRTMKKNHFFTIFSRSTKCTFTNSLKWTDIMTFQKLTGQNCMLAKVGKKGTQYPHTLKFLNESSYHLNGWSHNAAKNVEWSSFQDVIFNVPIYGLKQKALHGEMFKLTYLLLPIKGPGRLWNWKTTLTILPPNKRPSLYSFSQLRQKNMRCTLSTKYLVMQRLLKHAT